jgi:hypothetical protein
VLPPPVSSRWLGAQATAQAITTAKHTGLSTDSRIMIAQVNHLVGQELGDGRDAHT